MKTNNLKLIAFTALAMSLTGANAGFLFETAPAPQKTPQPGRQVDGGDVKAGARNVDKSAALERVSKMNRQRIDLESRLTSRVTQSGETPFELAIIRGMGRDVSFEDALRQILPGGWAAYSDQDLPLESRVTWTGNRTWPMVLNSVLVERDMRAHIDWKNQEVMFFVPALKEELTKPAPGALGVEVRTVAAAPVMAPAPVVAAPPIAAPSAAPAPSPAPVAMAVPTPAAPAPVMVAAAPVAPAPMAAALVAPAPAPSASPAMVVAPRPGKVEVREVIWTLAPEHTLRENLRRWSTAVNWNLVWNAVNGENVIDYPVDAKVEFSGELLGATGALAKVITAYRDADYPLEIEFYRGNRVVEVRLHRIPDAKAEPTDPHAIAVQRVPLPADALPQKPSLSLLGN